MTSRSSIVAGIDLAAQPKGTAIAILHGCTVAHLQIGTDDNAIERLSRGVVKIGIDCPLGWPNAFIDFVTAHRDGRPVATADTIDARRMLAYRVTDEHCRRAGLRPLSVSADRIGHAAFRVAGLLPRLGTGSDRSGEDRVVETYPAGSLQRWGLTSRGYKGAAGATVLPPLAARVESLAGLRFVDSAHRALFSSSDHAFDAVIAALTVRAAALGMVAPVPEDHRHAARVEGWIRLPTCELAELAETA